jgi:hypothetical protein
MLACKNCGDLFEVVEISDDLRELSDTDGLCVDCICELAITDSDRIVSNRLWQEEPTKGE